MFRSCLRKRPRTQGFSDSNKTHTFVHTVLHAAVARCCPRLSGLTCCNPSSRSLLWFSGATALGRSNARPAICNRQSCSPQQRRRPGKPRSRPRRSVASTTRLWAQQAVSTRCLPLAGAAEAARPQLTRSRFQIRRRTRAQHRASTIDDSRREHQAARLTFSGTLSHRVRRLRAKAQMATGHGVTLQLTQHLSTTPLARNRSAAQACVTRLRLKSFRTAWPRRTEARAAIRRHALELHPRHNMRVTASSKLRSSSWCGVAEQWLHRACVHCCLAIRHPVWGKLQPGSRQ